MQITSEMQLDIKGCVSQCYVGASVMSVQVSVQKYLKGTKSVYIYCCAHCLNLVLVDIVKAIPAAEDFFRLLHILYVFMSSSKALEYIS